MLGLWILTIIDEYLLVVSSKDFLLRLFFGKNEGFEKPVWGGSSTISGLQDKLLVFTAEERRQFRDITLPLGKYIRLSLYASYFHSIPFS